MQIYIKHKKAMRRKNASYYHWSGFPQTCLYMKGIVLSINYCSSQKLGLLENVH